MGRTTTGDVQAGTWTQSCESPLKSLPPAPRRRPPSAEDSTGKESFDSAEVVLLPFGTGRFTTVAVLAKSVHGEVQLLMDTKAERNVVAKVVSNAVLDESQNSLGSEWRTWFGSDEVVVVEDVWNEIMVLNFLQASFQQSLYVVQLIGVFQDDCRSYIVTEHCEGGELLNRVIQGGALPEGERRRFVAQLLRAVQYLHRHNIGHRDISLENVLLRRGDCVLADFGQAVRLRGNDGTILRYCAEAAKPMYRAPEMYVPRSGLVEVVCPPDGVPGAVVQVLYSSSRVEIFLPSEAVPGHSCYAEPIGYQAGPADLFACGVCNFVLATGKAPWAVARDVDSTFAFIRRHGVRLLLSHWLPSRSAENNEGEDLLIEQLLSISPPSRPSADEALNSSWLLQAPPRGRSQSS